ncbi:MAG TPA: hypothetical protein VH950_01030 [Gaiellaceae bacterium]|jgi:hypothetical protein
MVAAERRNAAMLMFGPEVTTALAADRAERLREAATARPGGLRRLLGSVMIAAGRRLDPEAPALRRGASPCEGSHLMLTGQTTV